MLNDNYGVINDMLVNKLPRAVSWIPIVGDNLAAAFPEHKIAFLARPNWALPSAIAVDVWKTTPFMALLLLAGLQVIPGDVYEAAVVDGASKWKQFWQITLPLLRPAILVALIFRTLDALRIFDLPYVLTQGQFGTSTLSTIAQENFATNRIYGLGSAMAVLTFIVVMLVSFSYIRFVGGNIRGLADE
jgi:multiple sugar transport system permease protein